MSSSQLSLSPSDFFLWLADHPTSLEPGLWFDSEPLELSADVSVPLVGTDPLGRPVLVFWIEEADRQLESKLLEVVGRIREESGRFGQRFAQPEQPRVLLLGSKFSLETLRNLELLSKAFPLRVWQVGVDEGQETPSPILDLCVPAARPQLQEWVKGEPEGMPETSVHFLRRFLNGVQ